MDYMGIEKERLWMQWISASEGQIFAEVVTEFAELLREMPPMRGRLQSAKQEV
jgi:coenzyme F420-reducing hydrogenase delta subunit